MNKLVGVAVLLLLAAPAMAEPWYARGSFNGWGTGNQMAFDPVDNRYEATVDISGQTPGDYFEFKVANQDWSTSFPPDNVKTKYPARSSLDFYYYPGQTLDGWFPEWDRVGYDVAGTGWEVMGDMNGEAWSVPHPMTDLGGGLYRVDILIQNAGTYYFKFRGTNDWEVSVGAHFGRFAPNATFDAWGGNEIHRFELDLPHGRARSYYLPEPATLALLLIGGLAVLRRK